MGEDGCAAATDILGHTNFGTFNLGSTTLPAQLLDHFNDLIHPRGADRVAAGFQPTPGGDGDTPPNLDLTVQPQTRSSFHVRQSQRLPMIKLP